MKQPSSLQFVFILMMVMTGFLYMRSGPPTTDAQTIYRA